MLHVCNIISLISVSQNCKNTKCNSWSNNTVNIGLGTSEVLDASTGKYRIVQKFREQYLVLITYFYGRFFKSYYKITKKFYLFYQDLRK